MWKVYTFVALAAIICQSSAQIDITTFIEKTALDSLVSSKCGLIKNERHHKNIDPKKLYFHWYKTRSNKKSTLNLEQAAKDFKKEYDFKNNDPIYLYITGFNANNESKDVAFLANGLAKVKNINFILLDSSFYLKHDNVPLAEAFLKAVTNLYGIGQILGDVLASFINDGLREELLNVIGHSVGAHIAGYVGQRVYDIRHKKIKRISGIDPSRPCFDNMEIADQLSSDDAEYVDIYHSNKGVGGTDHSLGTANFFINSGGPRQPSCIGIPLIQETCSHVWTSLNFWVDSSAHPEKFIAQKCDSYEHWEEGKCKTWPKAKAGMFSEPSKGDFYIAYDFDYISILKDKIWSALKQLWHTITSVFE